MPAAGSLAIVALIGAVLVLGLGVPRAVDGSQPLVSLDFALPKPPPPPLPKPPPPEKKTARAKGKPSPRNLRNQATPIVAPPVVQPLIVPPPVVTAPIAGIGAAANTGASDRAGPGQGAGGNGNGFGGGGEGGDGDGDSVVGPRQIEGKLSMRDLPEGMLDDGRTIGVEVLFTVRADGSVTRCGIERSSGYPAVDALTCRLIEQRFRFRPARDAYGRAVSSRVIESHTWVGNGR